MKNTKKILAVACAMALSAAIAVGGTLAYLTSTSETVTNTFTVGNVAITLDEAPVDVYGDVVAGDRTNANTYKLIPGHNYAKDPTVHVTAGSEQCWLFVEVTNAISEIEADTTIADQMTANGWAAVTGATNIFAYNSVVDARETAVDKVVFEGFTISDDADLSDYAGQTITIKAYAVQADGFDSAPEAWDASFGA